jgi:hypothetical protein
MPPPVPSPPVPPGDDSRLDGERWTGWRTRLGAVQGWIGDLGRGAWALVALNARKSLFRWRPGLMPCPCQNPSDSGRANQTACEPVASWHRPERFRRVCPLLRRQPDGAWKCSVNAAQVRPFWGRAAAYGGSGALAVWIAATLAVFVFLRSVGYPVRFRSVAWPGGWPQIREARARYFFALAERDLRENNPVGASMALSQSYDLDPRNYAAGRILAQLWQPGGAEILNRLYRQLMADHPQLRAATAQAWFQALLQHGDFATIATLAQEQLAAQPAQAGPWLNALLVATRRTGDPSALRRALPAPPPLPPYVAQVCRLELDLRAAGPTGARDLLARAAAAPAAPFLEYYVIDRQIHAGLTDDALWQLDHAGRLLAPRDRATLALEVSASLGWRVILAGQVRQLLAGGVSAPLVEMLSAHLIRHPDAAVLAEVCAAVDLHPLPADADGVRAAASLFCAAGANGDAERTRALAQTLRRLTGSRLAVLDEVGAWLLGEPAAMPAERYLPALPELPPEVDFALFDFSDRRRRLTNPARPTTNPIMIAP